MFYDLNVPVDGVGDLARRELLAMAMQLGYSGVAANHVVTGPMGETDRCRIRPLELQMILSAAPGVAESARFHQKLLGVPLGQPFRQFSRITVVVDNLNQANVVNSVNPVLKSYDLVAVRPTNQKMFNLACSQLEVDVISLDFTQRLPIRLKPPLVKAAVERGIYFEICYGRALVDPKARRELFINSRHLQEGARGRNIVVCSGARRPMEMRGPNDVANMATLFGFSQESAKNSVSRFCKSLLLHGVTRKTYKAAIHVERVPSQAKSNGGMFDVPRDWDPLSMGGASADIIPEPETPKKTLPTSRSGTLLGEVKVAFSEADGGNTDYLQSLNVLAVTEAINPGGITSRLSSVASKTKIATSFARTTGNQLRRGNAVLGADGEEGQDKNKAKRRKKKK
ncbi:hypothetical protein R1flu_014301 [Riccia fluitans]|uniref:Uncharacterized protein n=1 Tax=Riccia fluitans TaxID=41844 RepID=A0ABD1YG15_9MARC